MRKFIEKLQNSEKFLKFSDVLGWIGMGLLLGAYALVSLGIVDGTAVTYQVLTILGAFCMFILSVARKAYPNVALNLVWCVIGVIIILSVTLR